MKGIAWYKYIHYYWLFVHTCIWLSPIYQPPAVPLSVSGGQPLESGSLPAKEQLVDGLAHCIDASLNEWTTQTFSNLTDLCTYNHRQFLELKVCIDLLETYTCSCAVSMGIILCVFQGFVERSKGNLFHLKDKVATKVWYTHVHGAMDSKNVLVSDTKKNMLSILQYYILQVLI